MLAEIKNSVEGLGDKVSEISQEVEQKDKRRKIKEKGLEDMGRGKGKLGQSERVVWTYIHYQM